MIALVVGGARSGKSRHAQALARGLSDRPIYLATSRRWDDDHAARIARHQQDRGPEWTTLEEERRLARPEVEGRVVVVDCLTLWLTNVFLDEQQDVERTRRAAFAELEALARLPGAFVLVSNELGMAPHAPTEMGRKFVDLQGLVNQHAASLAASVTLMVAGVPVAVRGDASAALASALGLASAPGAAPLLVEPAAAAAAARAHQAQLTKPAGSLGRLEDVAEWYVGVVGRFPVPRPTRTAHVVFAADHGVAAEGVSAYPSAVTAAMVGNMIAGGAAVNVLARRRGTALTVVDVGVAADVALPRASRPDVAFVAAKIRPGTVSFRRAPAMSREEAERALAVGAGMARELAEDGVSLSSVGEVGIGNTTAAAALVSAMTGAPPAETCGRGTGLDDEGLARKVLVVADALALHRPVASDPVGVLAAVGGLEIAAMAGFFVEAARRRLPVVLDGYVATAAALVASAIEPRVTAALIASHESAERGAARALAALGLSPLLSLGLRLGEGTGALLAMDLVDAAVALLGEMATFASAAVPDRVRDGA